MSRSLTRRQLGLAATGALTLAGTVRSAEFKSQAENSSDQAGGDFDPVRWTKERHDSAPLRLTFKSNTKSEAEFWQQTLRTKLIELLGGFPSRIPLNPETIAVREFPAYSRETIVFESRPNVRVWAYLLTPKTGSAPFPTVVCIPGHGYGVDDIVGIDEHGNDRAGKPGYQHDFALQVVEHGMAALAIEPLAFGHRRDPVTREKGPKATACQPAAGSALLLGETMIGWRVWDTMRAVDWIGTRRQLDSQRIGCMGISGGGTCTMFTAALEPRIRAAFVSGYLNTFRESIMSVSHCIDNYVPGILNWAENYDVAGLIAPRPFFAEGGTRDPIFPVHATRESFARVKKVYEVFGAADRAGLQIFDGVHEFHGVEGIPFLVAALKS